MKDRVAAPLRQAVQDLLQEQAKAAAELQAALDAGDLAALKPGITRLTLAMQRVKDMQSLLGDVEAS